MCVVSSLRGVSVEDARSLSSGLDDLFAGRITTTVSKAPEKKDKKTKGKSDAPNPFLMVPRASFEICAKCVKSAQLFFFEPSGGKSDAADPFLILPRLSFEVKYLCCPSSLLGYSYGFG